MDKGKNPVTRRSIYLVGFSGTGKSTIAKLIGAKLKWPVYDLDQIIAEQSGISIPDIFQREGEEGFRLRETKALQALPDAGFFVVATGGGAVIRQENRMLMENRGWIICLEGRPETLHSRLQQQSKKSSLRAVRPLLDAADPLDQVSTLKNSRQVVYALADWTVHTDRLTPEQVAEEVIRAADLLDRSMARQSKSDLHG